MEENKQAAVTSSGDKVNIFLVIMSAVLGLLGLVFYALWHEKKPKASKVYALIGVISAVLYVLFIIVWFLVLPSFIEPII